MADLNRIIKYTNRDFNTIRNSLIDYSKTYFPNTYNDFSKSSTGMLFIEMTAYVGDVLSFYLDNQIQETFIQYAQQNSNVYNLAYMMGYKPKVTTVATATITFYQQVPSKTSGTGGKVPDFDYALKIPANAQITSNANSQIKFIVEDEVKYDNSDENLSDVVKNLLYKLSELKIEQCWGIMYNKGGNVIKHNHFPYALSFVYFIRSPKGSSPLIIESKRIKAEEGKMVIFHASQTHWCNPSKVNGRCCLVGNIRY